MTAKQLAKKIQSQFKEITSDPVEFRDELTIDIADANQISEFIDKADKNFYNAITDHVAKEKKKFETEPMVVEATDEELKQGVPKTYDIPIAFDQSNFFG